MAAPETPKEVSSRLLSMKFMQRAVASAQSTPNSNASSSKKRKSFHSPAQEQIDASINQASVQRALDEREAKRLTALRQHSSKDTQWVLSNVLLDEPRTLSQKPPMKVVYVGYGDASSDDEDHPSIGRMTTKASGVHHGNEAKNDSSEEAGRNTDPSAASHSVNRKSGELRHRSTSDSKEAARAKDFRDKRRRKDVNLGTMTSISGGGYQSNAANLCHRCRQPGHKVANCPERSTRTGRSHE